MGIFAVPVLLLGFAVRQQFGPLIDADEAAIKAATGFSVRHGLVPLLTAVQLISQPVFVYLGSLGVVVWAWRAKSLKGRALWALVTMLVGWSIGALSKLLVQRARPIIDDDMVPHASGYSFPSGHALNITLAACVMVFLVWPLLSTSRRVAIVVATVVVVTVGLDRVFIGAHFPSDVAAGFILGVGIVYSSWIGFIGKTAAISSPGPSHPA